MTIWPWGFSRLSASDIHFSAFFCLDADCIMVQGRHRDEKYLNLDGFLEKSLKIKYAWKSTEKSLKCLEKSLNLILFFCRT